MDISNYSCKFFGGSKALSSYLNDIRKYQVPSVEEEEELFKRVKDGDEKAKEEIVLRNQRFVYAIAKRYARDEDEVLDYVNEGNIGMMEAIEEFDPSKGFKFITYAVLYMRREMNYFMHNTNRCIRRPSSMRIEKKVDAVKSKYIAENGYAPSDEEILDLIKEYYNLDVKDVSDILDLNVSSINDSFDDDSYTMEDNLEYNNKTANGIDYYEEENKEYNSNLLDEIFEDSGIPEENKDILRMLFGIGYDAPCTLTEVGDKYDLDKESVIQIKNLTLKYLNNKSMKYKMAL